jgi:glycerol-3-phosphate dehydrogenase (NAD(P)+)
MMSAEKVAVLGGGTWGATLAAHLSTVGHDVAIWEFAPEVAAHLERERSLKTLPQLKLPVSILVSNDMGRVLTERSVVLSVTPSHAVRPTFENAVKSGMLQDGAMVISASKGIENNTFLTMSQIISQVFPKAGDIAILTGPSHAEEVADGQPVALVAACTSATGQARVKNLFSSDKFRVYTGADTVGAELGAALKNVYAVACGIVDGLGLGDNTKAALMTRGLAEMARLGQKMGAKPVTFFGLSGLGDLIVTCGSRHSRNRSLGEKVGQGNTLEQALKQMTMVAEGVNATRSAHNLSMAKHVDMPIVTEVYKILFENKPPRDSIRDLMSRNVGPEMEGIAL